MHNKIPKGEEKYIQRNNACNGLGLEGWEWGASKEMRDNEIG